MTAPIPPVTHIRGRPFAELLGYVPPGGSVINNPGQGGGGGGVLGWETVTLFSYAVATVDLVNQGSGASEMLRTRYKVDPSPYGVVRLIADIEAVGAGSARLVAQWSDDGVTWYAFGATQDCEVSLAAASGGPTPCIVGPWCAITTQLTGDSFIRVMAVGGNGAATPMIGSLFIQFAPGQREAAAPPASPCASCDGNEGSPSLLNLVDDLCAYATIDDLRALSSQTDPPTWTAGYRYANVTDDSAPGVTPLLLVQDPTAWNGCQVLRPGNHATNAFGSAWIAAPWTEHDFWVRVRLRFALAVGDLWPTEQTLRLTERNHNTGIIFAPLPSGDVEVYYEGWTGQTTDTVAGAAATLADGTTWWDVIIHMARDVSVDAGTFTARLIVQPAAGGARVVDETGTGDYDATVFGPTDWTLELPTVHATGAIEVGGWRVATGADPFGVLP